MEILNNFIWLVIGIILAIFIPIIKRIGFIQKLKCKFNKVRIEQMDERLTTVAAHKTMNLLDIKNKKKKNIVDTLSAVYILEMYINKKN